MTYTSEDLQQQADSTSNDIASRILRDVNRKTRVIVLIPGTASVSVNYPKVTLSTEDDLLRVAVELSKSGLTLVQAEGPLISTLDQFAQLLKARIYGLTDLPDLSISPTDQLMLNRYEPLSYFSLPTVLDHVKSLTAVPDGVASLVFDEAFSPSKDGTGASPRRAASTGIPNFVVGGETKAFDRLGVVADTGSSGRQTTDSLMKERQQWKG